MSFSLHPFLLISLITLVVAAYCVHHWRLMQKHKDEDKKSPTPRK